ncbi:MAG: hypothetical protein K0S86_1412, partial [Geminicoccaceae bacterium]|nr:hypothetical protein [Geminicoccaceae bacterium]
MRVYRTSRGAVLEDGGAYYDLAADWDTLFNH